MKIISFKTANTSSFGAVVGDKVLDLKHAFDGRYSDLRSLLEGDALGEAVAIVKSQPKGALLIPLENVHFEPVIPNPGKIWCCGLNYHEHLKETNNEVTEQPVFFLRVADSQVGHEEPIVLPPESSQLDYEGEIAVIIGRAGRRITEENAWDHIAGYACYNDATLRDWQRHSKQWGPGKNFWQTGSFGPWMVTADELGKDPLLTLETRLNGVVVQKATTHMMVHSIPRQISYLSTIAPLCPGDVIVTGTPGGVGAKRQPPLWMRAGDVVEVEVDHLGVLRNCIKPENECL